MRQFVADEIRKGRVHKWPCAQTFAQDNKPILKHLQPICKYADKIIPSVNTEHIRAVSKRLSSHTLQKIHVNKNKKIPFITAGIKKRKQITYNRKYRAFLLRQGMTEFRKGMEF